MLNDYHFEIHDKCYNFVIIIKITATTMEAKVRKVGNSLGIILPKQLADDLHLKVGDKMSIDQVGSRLELRPIDPEFELWAEAYRQLNIDYKDVLEALAK
jgi:putative addiction module antidote